MNRISPLRGTPAAMPERSTDHGYVPGTALPSLDEASRKGRRPLALKDPFSEATRSSLALQGPQVSVVHSADRLPLPVRAPHAHVHYLSPGKGLKSRRFAPTRMLTWGVY